MHKHLCQLAVGLIVLALAGCATYSVKSDFDSSADFTGYSSFAIYDKSNLKDRLPIADQRVERSVRNEMTAKGFRAVTPGQADLFVAIHGATREKLDVTAYGYGGWHRRGYVEVDQYQEGTLIIDLIDSRAKEVVWRGSATGAIDDRPGRNEEKVAEVVAAILAKFPPQ